MQFQDGSLMPLDITHVLYDDSSSVSFGFAFITLSPILLMASYAALAVQTREFLIITMWLGQFGGEILNSVIKNMIKQERPLGSNGNGYGFPSSHSQYMAYFSSFLTCHLYFQHRFAPSGYPIVDMLWRAIVYGCLLLWTCLVAYSRYHLGYHNANQICWGLGIGSTLGVSLYFGLSIMPTCYPRSIFGKVKSSILNHPISIFLQIRDGWSIWADGGRSEEWDRWRREWERIEKESKVKR